MDIRASPSLTAAPRVVIRLISMLALISTLFLISTLTLIVMLFHHDAITRRSINVSLNNVSLKNISPKNVSPKSISISISIDSDAPGCWAAKDHLQGVNRCGGRGFERWVAWPGADCSAAGVHRAMAQRAA